MQLLRFAAAGLFLFTGGAFADATLGGKTTKLVVDPVSPSIVYAGSGPTTSASGVYKSTNWGVTWTLVFSMLNAPGDIEIDPQNHSTIYVSNGGEDSAAAIYKSADGGTTWSAADNGILPVKTVFAKDWIGPLAVDPTDSNVIYAASGNTGLYKSTDGGQDWATINSGLDTLTAENYTATQLLVDPASPSTIYVNLNVTTGGGQPAETMAPGLYKSTNGGATWNPTGLTGTNISGIAMDPENPAHLVACVAGAFTWSTDGGATWTTGASCPNSFDALVVFPLYPQRVIVGGASGGVWHSNDGGTTLSILPSLSGVPVFSLAGDPLSPNLYAGTNQGVYISRDGGGKWVLDGGTATSPQTIHVPADEPTIQAAIDAASSDDTVLVAPGTYYELLDFKGKAITLKSSDGAASTILDGNGSGPIVTFDTGEGNGSVLQGFTLTDAYRSNVGSAVYIEESSPILLDDVFVNNTEGSSYWGAAIGGDQASPTIVGSYFGGNTCGTGFSNSVVGFANESSPIIADDVFLNNSCPALYVETTPEGSPEIYNNTLAGNRDAFVIDSYGAGVRAFISNNLIAFNQYGLQLTLTNTVVFPAWSHNLVYGDITADYQGVASQTGANDNISVDPLLKDWTIGDVHLLYGSPAIDVGDSTVSQISATDFYGNARVSTGNPNGSSIVDIGASEYSPPVVTAVEGSATVEVNTSKSGVLGVSGADSTEPLVFAIVSQPAHGLVSITSSTGAFTYTPAQGYEGADSFTFRVTDPYGTVSNIAAEQFTITDIAPAANVGGVTTNVDTIASGLLSSTLGYSGQVVNYAVIAGPNHGVINLTASSGQFTYTPASGFVGTDSFTFQVTDTYGTPSGIATESITVNDIAPSVTDGGISLNAGASGSGTLSSTTAYAGQTLTFCLRSQPAHGVVSLNQNTGQFTYTPTSGFAGADSFSFQVKDAHGATSNTGTEHLTVEDVAPVASDGAVTTDAGIPASATVAVTTYPGQTLSYSIVTQPLHGGVTLNPSTGHFTYTPAVGFVGSDTFSFQVTDSYGLTSNVATVGVTVSDVAPTANAGTVTTVIDAATAGQVSTTLGYPGQDIQYSLITKASHGTVGLIAGNGQFTYKPVPGFVGTDSFTFQVTDSYGTASVVATESITVNDVAPTAESAVIKVRGSRPYHGTLGVTAAYPGQIFTYSIVSGASHGVVTVQNASRGNFTYQPAPGYRGTDSFTFQTLDQWGTPSNTATVSFTVK